MGEFLQIVDDGCDGDTAIYVNGRLHTTIHCNDRHELPSTLYELMVKHTFTIVEELMLTDEGRELYEGVHGDEYEHPESIETYAGKYTVAHRYKRGRTV